MFSISAFVIGPAINSGGDGTGTPQSPPPADTADTAGTADHSVHH